MKSINAKRTFFKNPTPIHDLIKKKLLKLRTKFPLPDKEYLQKPYS